MSNSNIDLIYDALFKDGIELEDSIEWFPGKWQSFKSTKKYKSNKNIRIFISVCTTYAIYGEWGINEFKRIRLEKKHLTKEDEQRIIAYKRKEIEQRKVLYNRVLELWKKSHSADSNHPYLLRKHIPPIFCKQYKGNLVIGVYNIQGQMEGLQFISSHPNIPKDFLRGSRIKNNFMIIGDRITPTIRFVEGYATGVSIYLGCEDTTIVCFSANNIPNVTAIFRRKYPTHFFIICGDNDPAGWSFATKAYKADRLSAIGRCAIITPFYQDKPINDFNDLHTLYGLEAVEGQLAKLNFINN